MSESFDAAKLAALLDRVDDFLDMLIVTHAGGITLSKAALRLRGELVQAIGELRGQETKIVFGRFRAMLPEKVRNQPRPNAEQTWPEFETKADFYEYFYGNVFLWCPNGEPAEAFVLNSANVARDGDRYRVRLYRAGGDTSRFVVVDAKEIVHSFVSNPPPMDGCSPLAAGSESFAECVRQACDTITEQMKPVLDAAGLPADHPLSRLMEAKESEPETQTWRDRPSML